MLYKLTTSIMPGGPKALSAIAEAMANLSKIASIVFYDDSQLYYEIYFIGETPPSTDELIKYGTRDCKYVAQLTYSGSNSHSLISSQLQISQSQQDHTIAKQFKYIMDIYNKNSEIVSLLFDNAAESKAELSSPSQALNSNSTTAETELQKLIHFYHPPTSFGPMGLPSDSNASSAMMTETNLQQVSKYHLKEFLRNIHSKGLTPSVMNDLMSLLIHDKNLMTFSSRSHMPRETEAEFVHISLNFIPEKHIFSAPDTKDKHSKISDIISQSIQNILFDSMYCPQIDVVIGKKNLVIEIYLHFVVLNHEKERFQRQIAEAIWATGLRNALQLVMITHIARPCLLDNMNCANLQIPIPERQLTIFPSSSSLPQPVPARVVQLATQSPAATNRTDTVMMDRRPSQG